MEIQVQKVKNDWSVFPGGVTFYIIGQPKSGKTTAVSKWSETGSNSVLLIDTDLGADWVEGANIVPCVSLNAPTRSKMSDDGKMLTDPLGKELKEIIPPEERDYYYRTGENKGKPMPVYSLAEILTWLRHNIEKLGYTTIVIDTIDEVNGWIEDVVVEELGISGMGQGSWGSDWGKARRKNLDIIIKLQKFTKKYGINLVLTSHSKTSTVTDDKVQLSPDLPKGLANALTAKADVIGYTTGQKKDDKYYISFKAYDERMIGSRLRPLAQKELLFSYKAIKEQLLNYKEEEENNGDS